MNNLETVISVIEYIENNLGEKISLDSIAKNIHYSKYYLHRIFTREIGITVHNYILRRKLTEAAKELVFTNKTILEISLGAGYESQQAFSFVFKEMYKKSPNKFREDKEFYPLQLPYSLHNCGFDIDLEEVNWKKDICLANKNDIVLWMELVKHVVDGFPGLNEEDYMLKLERRINERGALIMKEGDMAIGALGFNYLTAEIEFLGIHPLYKKIGLERIFLMKLRNEFLQNRDIYISTFREGDKADIGYRDSYLELGFVEEQCQIEFGYPTQKFVLKNNMPVKRR